MTPPACFISDIHLSASRLDIQQRFFGFLHALPGTAETLYILGDLFDYWVGDDCAEELGYGPALDALAQLAEAGVVLYVMHGNRDFLLGDDFYRRSGARPLAASLVLETHGRRIFLCHGDELCTDDVEHQRTRNLSRDPAWQSQFLSKPLAERMELAGAARQRSAQNAVQQPGRIMDVTEEAVEQAFRQSQTRCMIHGHTHRPARHRHRIDGRQCERIVLGDWYEQHSVLWLDEEHFRCEPASD